MSPGRVIISRTDSIGDVVLTLPMAGLVKEAFPDIPVTFLGREYTRPVIEACRHVDEFIDRETFLHAGGTTADTIIHVFPDPGIAWKARALGIPLRIGTSHRWFHWPTCNALVNLSRRKSDLHEAQLNLRLLEQLVPGAPSTLPFEIWRYYGLSPVVPIHFPWLESDHGPRVILHPGSQGSAREWGLDHFIELARILIAQGYVLWVTGTEKEREGLHPLLQCAPGRIRDLVGLLDLGSLISVISRSDALVANSTGPLHIASAVGKVTVGLFPSIRPMHPGRWAPLGPKAIYLALDKECAECARPGTPCQCIRSISPNKVAERINRATRS